MPGSRGVPPKKRGRFIPCRGGGTATTYYTDAHDVDENKMTIMSQGGRWDYATWAGIMNRNLCNGLYETYGTVASRLIYLS